MCVCVKKWGKDVDIFCIRNAHVKHYAKQLYACQYKMPKLKRGVTLSHALFPNAISFEPLYKDFVGTNIQTLYMQKISHMSFRLYGYVFCKIQEMGNPTCATTQLGSVNSLWNSGKTYPSKHPTLDQRWNLVGFWSRRRRPKYNVGTTLNRRCQVHVQLLRRINVGYWLDFGRDRDDKSTTSVQRKIVMSVRRLITTSYRRIFTWFYIIF